MSVYFIRDGNGRVKIGWAVNPQKRLRELQCATSEVLTLARVIDGGRCTEAWFHKKFRILHVRGEWFRFSSEMLSIEVPKEEHGNGQSIMTTRELIRQYGVLKIAKALGITHGAVSQWQRVPAERMFEVSRITGIPLSKLRPDLWEVWPPEEQP